MSTTGIQNYLSNVFRPIYTFDTTLSNFVPRLELSNIDNYSGNTISVFTAAVGDSNSNVYVGSNAGNPFNITRNCRNITALGYAAGSNISNDSNSIYIGWYAGSSGSNSRDVISIGTNSGGNGSSNVFVGTNTGTVGQSNVLIGHFISPVSVSNQIRIGYSNQIPIASDLSKMWVGLCGYTSPVHTNDKLDVSGNLYVLGNIGVNTEPGVEATLDVNGDFQSDDGHGRLRFLTTAGNSDLSFSNYSGGTATMSVAGTVNVSGSVQSSQGYSSVRGSIEVNDGTPQTIGQLKRGIVQVSAVSQAGSAERAASIFFAYTTSNVITMFSHSNSFTSLSISGQNIQISNNTTTGTYDYNVTYFPLP